MQNLQFDQKRWDFQPSPAPPARIVPHVLLGGTGFWQSKSSKSKGITMTTWRSGSLYKTPMVMTKPLEKHVKHVIYLFLSHLMFKWLQVSKSNIFP